MVGSTPSDDTSSLASSESPNLTSLEKPLLLQVMSLLDVASLKHIRLTNKFLKDTSDDLITFINYGTATDCCNPEQLDSVAERWPKIKIIKLSFLKRLSDVNQADSEAVKSALERLVLTKWTAIEEFIFPKANYDCFALGTNVSGARALAACTVSWGRLRKLKMQNVVCHEGLDVLATHGAFPSLEELDLSWSQFRSNKTLAGAALAKLASRAPKLRKLKLSSCFLGFILIPLLETELPNLELINLTRCSVEDKILSKLNPEKWHGLSTLVLKDNPFSSTGLESLFKKEWKRLRHLDLSDGLVVYEYNTDGFQSLVAASSAGRLPSSTSLALCGFAGILFASFARASWHNLERLAIGGKQFGRGGIVDFLASVDAQRFPALKSLTLHYDGFNQGHFADHFTDHLTNDWDLLFCRSWNQIEELKLVGFVLN